MSDPQFGKKGDLGHDKIGEEMGHAATIKILGKLIKKNWANWDVFVVRFCQPPNALPVRVTDVPGLRTCRNGGFGPKLRCDRSPVCLISLSLNRHSGMRWYEAPRKMSPHLAIDRYINRDRA